MKALLILTYYAPHRTGLTIHVQLVAESLARRGHEVTVLTSRYRPDLLIQTIPYLVARFPELRIVFAGEYLIRYEDFYERCAPLIAQYRDRLVFLGLLQNPQEMADYFSLCDVLVLPSGTECFGMVQAEAMLCGTPVVVSDTPGAREVVRVTGMGEIFTRCDVPALAEAIARVLQNRAAYLVPRDKIAATFDLERTVDGYEQLFREGIGT